MSDQMKNDLRKVGEQLKENNKLLNDMTSRVKAFGKAEDTVRQERDRSDNYGRTKRSGDLKKKKQQ